MADEILDSAAADATGTTEPIETGSTSTGIHEVTDPNASAIDTSAEPNTTPEADELSAFEKLFPKDEEPAADVPDPNAAAPAVSEAMQKAFAVSEYVKDESQVENAIRAADEVFNVQLGKIPAHQMLEGFRARSPEQFEKVVRDSLIPYIEHLTGQKLGGAQGEAPDPLKTLQAEVERLKGEPARMEAERQAVADRNQADTLTNSHVEGLIKASSGVFDDATNDAINAMAAQLPKLGINPNQLMADVRAGKTADLDRAFKAAEKAQLTRLKTMGGRLIARSKTLKAALPPGKGNPAAAAAPGELPIGSSREAMIAFLKG